MCDKNLSDEILLFLANFCLQRYNKNREISFAFTSPRERERGNGKVHFFEVQLPMFYSGKDQKMPIHFIDNLFKHFFVTQRRRDCMGIVSSHLKLAQ